jgi:hypothetical protein
VLASTSPFDSAALSLQPTATTNTNQKANLVERVMVTPPCGCHGTARSL